LQGIDEMARESTTSEGEEQIKEREQRALQILAEPPNCHNRLPNYIYLKTARFVFTHIYHMTLTCKALFTNANCLIIACGI